MENINIIKSNSDAFIRRLKIKNSFGFLNSRKINHINPIKKESINNNLETNNLVISKSKDEMITVAMCTQPYRKQQMLKVVSQLLPQCDRMCICFNEYDEIPEELPKSDKLVCVLAGEGKQYKDLGCLNKMLWYGDFPGYYATVDDDINYPSNYISELKKKVDFYNKQCICSFHGVIYGTSNGSLIFDKNKIRVFAYCYKHLLDMKCHSCGMGVAMSYPSKIGLDKSIYLNRPKNFGDDELTAVWAQENNVNLICISNENLYLNADKVAYSGLYSDKEGVKKRHIYLNTYNKWISEEDTFFRIIIPAYNTSNYIDRCLQSINNQTFKRFKVVVVDDNSEKLERLKIEAIVKKYNFCKLILNDVHSDAGGCRNLAINEFKDCKYTLFLDSDDYYTSKNSLQQIYCKIMQSNYPDIVRCSFTFCKKENSELKILNENKLEDIKNTFYIAPWTCCIKTEKCCNFVSNRRRSNDVVWFIRQIDNVKTITSVQESIVNYTTENVFSAWNSTSIKDERIEASKYYVIADLYNEKFKSEISNYLKDKYISIYKKYIKNW